MNFICNLILDSLTGMQKEVGYWVDPDESATEMTSWVKSTSNFFYSDIYIYYRFTVTCVDELKASTMQ